MAPIELFAFRFRDPVTGKFVRARFLPMRDEIATPRGIRWPRIGRCPRAHSAPRTVGFLAQIGVEPVPRHRDDPLRGCNIGLNFLSTGVGVGDERATGRFLVKRVLRS
jgi:hypothetical protein